MNPRRKAEARPQAESLPGAVPDAANDPRGTGDGRSSRAEAPRAAAHPGARAPESPDLAPFGSGLDLPASDQEQSARAQSPSRSRDRTEGPPAGSPPPEVQRPTSQATSRAGTRSEGTRQTERPGSAESAAPSSAAARPEGPAGRGGRRSQEDSDSGAGQRPRRGRPLADEQDPETAPEQPRPQEPGPDREALGPLRSRGTRRPGKGETAGRGERPGSGRQGRPPSGRPPALADSAPGEVGTNRCRLAQLIAAAPPPPPAPPRSSGGEPRFWRGFKLSEFQVRAIDAVADGKNVLVGAPTGAGKTLVAEYAIEDAILRKRRCIYTSPIKALSNQKFRDFRDDPRVEVGLMTGDVTLHPAAQVLIMTTEILRNAILENPRQLSDVEYVVFDEVHFLDDAERGTVWEESLIFAPPSVRFICLSATVANIHELGKWIGQIRSQPLEVIESSWRPVPLTHRLWHPRTDVFELQDLEHVRRRTAGLFEASSRSERRGRGRRDDRGGGRPPRPMQPEPDLLIDQIIEVGALPALVFSFSRKDCERHARRNSGRELLSRDERARMATLEAELTALFRLPPSAAGNEIFQLARRGIGYHHAGMLPIDKELVERLFTSGLLKLLFTTETFALGINMPARSVIFHSLKKFDGEKVDWLRTREYMQMAGRAGRQGLDRDGMVFSVLDDQTLAEAPVARILSGAPEPVMSRFKLSYSTILHLIVSLGRERLVEAWEKSFHHFQHRAGTAKAQARLKAEQRGLLEAHLAFLTENGYLDAQDRLTPKGSLARLINGYEIQLTELAFRGVLENLPPRALAMIFAALVWEERRRGGGPFLPFRMFGTLRKQVDEVLYGLTRSETRLGIPSPMKVADWGLTPAVLAWAEGAPMEDLSEVTEALPGDVVRCLRMALQFMRQVRRAIDPGWDLGIALDNAVAMVNRDEMDARAQLDLG